jgi:hypothetical protein
MLKLTLGLTAALALVLAMESPSSRAAGPDTLDLEIQAQSDGNLRSSGKEKVFNIRPVFTLSVGVSFYGKRARSKFPSLPAHALSAAMMLDSLDRSYHYMSSNKSMLRLITDLRLPPGELGNLGILDHLAQSVGVDAIQNPLIPYGPNGPYFLQNEDGNFPYIGSNQFVSRQGIGIEVERALKDVLEAKWEQDINVVLFYFAAHGIYTTDGTLHLVAADADAEDPSTWTKIDDLLAPIYAFAAEGGNAGLKRRVLVILDICQQGDTPQAHPIAAPPRGVAVLQSASPGQHAWHFETNRKYAQTSTTNGGTPHTMQADLKSTMSFLPLSLRQAINTMGDDLPEPTTEPGPDGKIHIKTKFVTLEQIFAATKTQMKHLVDADPAAQRDGGQTMSIAYGDGAAAMNFLELVKVDVPIPYEKKEGRVYALELQ